MRNKFDEPKANKKKYIIVISVILVLVFLLTLFFLILHNLHKDEDIYNLLNNIFTGITLSVSIPLTIALNITINKIYVQGDIVVNQESSRELQESIKHSNYIKNNLYTVVSILEEKKRMGSTSVFIEKVINSRDFMVKIRESVVEIESNLPLIKDDKFKVPLSNILEKSKECLGRYSEMDKQTNRPTRAFNISFFKESIEFFKQKHQEINENIKAF